MGMAAILVSGQNLSNTGPEASEEKFEFLNIFSHTNVWCPYKWKFGSKLDLAVKRSNINVQSLL